MNASIRALSIIGAHIVLAGCGEQTATIGEDGVIFGELTMLSPTLEDGSRYAEHPIELQAGERLDVTMQSTEFDTYLRLTDDNGFIIGEDDDSAGGTNANLVAIVPESGVYIIVANTFAAEDYGEYLLAVRRSMPDNVHGIYVGTLPEIDGKSFDSVAYPVHSVTVAAGETLDAQLASADFDAMLQIRDGAGNVIAEDDDSGGGTNARISLPIGKPGTYDIVVRSYADEGAGAYTLTVLLDEASSDSTTRQISGELTASSPRLDDDTPYEPWAIEADAGEQLDITMRSDAFDSYLQVHDSAGMTLGVDDDSGGGLNAQLHVVAPEAGRYTIVANSVGSDAAGSYEIVLRRSAADTSNGPGSIEILRGSLSADQQVMADGTPVSPHTIDAKAGDRFSVMMIAADFDAYLVVFDADNRKLSEDDDSGGGTNARLSFIAPTDGSYRIAANSFDGNAEGDYLITLQRD